MEEARKLLQRLLMRAQFEHFETGFDSFFSLGLEEALLGEHGGAMFELLDTYLDEPTVNTEIAYETMRLLGRLEHPQSHAFRLGILVRALGHSDPYLRDAAGLALVDLEDPRALPALQKAAACEPIPSLREDLLQAAAQLV